MIAFSQNPVVAEQQMTAIITYLITFGYIDGQFDVREKVFIHEYIHTLVRMRVEHMGIDDDAARAMIAERQTRYFERVFERVHLEIRHNLDEVVAAGESLEEFVLAKLRLRCFELFKELDPRSQGTLLQLIDELVAADGRVDPREKRFRDELVALLQDSAGPPRAQPRPVEAAAAPRVPPMLVTAPSVQLGSLDNHPLLMMNEQHFSSDPARLARQITADHALIRQALDAWDVQRRAGDGRLDGMRTARDLGGAPFLDKYVYGMAAPARATELIVLGDLHGCYSCLKAALLQSDFFPKAAAARRDPAQPDVKLIFLGDYIDRGMYSYNGVLRTVLQLFVSMPESVYVLRGNHEYYVDLGGKIVGGVRPAEAIATFESHMPRQMFEAYMMLFEHMPSMLLCDRTLFVHAGIPRDRSLEERWRDLTSLNDKDLRFQMMWSDPANANHVPHELQAHNARFPFGRMQFRAFMERIGCDTMVRGHEKIDAGFKVVFDDGDTRLLNLFSSGGAQNADLPANASYRSVTPMALTIKVKAGQQAVATPWAIDWSAYNQAQRNGFYKSQPEIEFRVG